MAKTEPARGFYQFTSLFKQTRNGEAFRDEVYSAYQEIFGDGELSHEEIANRINLLCGLSYDRDSWKNHISNVGDKGSADRHYVHITFLIFAHRYHEKYGAPCRDHLTKILQSVWDADLDWEENLNKKCREKRIKNFSIVPRLDEQVFGPSTSFKSISNGNSAALSMAEFSQQHQKLEEELASFLEGYEPHGLQEIIRDKMCSVRGGTWLLTSGPGIGKSALTAATAQLMGDDGIVLPYVFRQERKSNLENRAEGFHNFIASFMHHNFGIATAAIEATIDPATTLRRMLFEAHERGDFSEATPLYIIIDGLDEMHGFTYNGKAAINPLNLPSSLPESVYILCSLRLKDTDTLSEILPPPFNRVHLTKDNNFDLHKDTVHRYARRICEGNKLITPYHGTQELKKSDKEKEGFIGMVCQNAEYNFAILRSVLNESEYWIRGGKGIDLTGDLEEYYQKHLVRMIESERYGPRAKAGFCFALQSYISEDSFSRLMGRSNTGDLELTNNLLTEWKKQGLIVSFKSNEQVLLRPYHSTYESFLRVEFEKADKAKILSHFLDNLVQYITSQNHFAALDDLSSEQKRETIKFLTNLAVHTGRTTTLQRLLQNVEIWKIVCRSIGIGSLLDPIARLPFDANSASERKFFLNSMANLLIGWIDTQQLISSDNTPYTFGTFLPYLRSAEIKRDRNWISLYSFVKANDEKLKDRRLDYLFFEERIARSIGNLEEAGAILKEIGYHLHGGDPTNSQWHSYYYEMAKVCGLNGDATKAVSNFKKGAEISIKNNDHLGKIYDLILANIFSYFDRSISAEHCYDQLGDLYDELESIRLRENYDVNRLESTEHELLLRLVELAFEIRSQDFEKWHLLYQQQPWTKENSMLAVPRFVHLGLRIEGWRESMLGNYDSAASMFCSFLDVAHLPIPEVSRQDLDEVRQFVSETAEETARDYRDGGFALANSNLDDAQTLARKVWQIGLDTVTPSTDNKRFLTDMRSLLSNGGR